MKACIVKMILTFAISLRFAVIFNRVQIKETMLTVFARLALQVIHNKFQNSQFKICIEHIYVCVTSALKNFKNFKLSTA